MRNTINGKNTRNHIHALAMALAVCGIASAVEPQVSLVTGQPVGKLAVAGRLDIDLHAQFMASRTFEKDTVLNWYNGGYSGGGRFTEVGGNFGDFGLHVPPAQRDEKYPRWATIDQAPAVRFDGNDILKGNFAVEDGAAGTEDLSLELWLRDESPAAGEVILGWQSEDGSATSAPLSWPASVKGSPQWRHLVVNCTADAETWFIDGKQVQSGPRKLIIQKSHRMVLGGAGGTKPSFAGDLAAVRLHAKAMTAEQIAHNFQGGVMLGTEMHSWWRNEDGPWWSAESKHFRHCVDKKEMADWNEKQTREFHDRVPRMFKMAEDIYHIYGERLALRMPVVSTKPEYRGDGIKYKIPIQPSQGSWMGWDGKLGFGFACQGAGHINPHELVHGCQAQTGGALEGNWWEAHANFPQTYAGIYQTLPPDCAPVSMLFPANGRNFYHDRLMFEHLAQSPEYGPMFVSKLWYDGRPAKEKQAYPWTIFTQFDPDPSTPLDYEWMRMAQRCVTWDFQTFDEKIPNLYAHTATRQKEKMNRLARTLLEPAPLEQGWWRVPRQLAPQQLGYNICPLKLTAGRVSVEIAGEFINQDRGSDWRAALVAVDAEGKPRYSNIAGTGKTLTFEPGTQAKELYLVVCATPKNILNVPMTGDYRSPEQELFPYKVRLNGCEPLDVLLPADPGVPGARHPNGGGFVATSAKAEPTAYVGPNAQVLGKAQVLGNARIEDFAVVTDNAIVRDSAILSGHAKVSRNAVIRDNAKVRDYATVDGSTIIRDRARLLEHASTWNDAREMYGDATLKGIASVGASVGGSAIIDGHYAKANEVTRGAWFTWSWGTGKNAGEMEQELGGLQAQYTFETPHPGLAWDTHSANHAYLRGKPLLVAEPSRKGNVMALNGRDQWLEFPRSVIDLHDLTIDLSVNWDGGPAGQRLVEVTDAGGNLLCLTPSDADGKLTFVMRKDGREQSLKAPALPTGVWTRIQVMLSGDTGRLYINGKMAAENRQLSLNPEDLKPQLCLIGRGTSGGFFKGRLDDVSFYCNSQIDDTPPTPDPAAFNVRPVMIDGTRIIMSAVPGADPLGNVEYLFEETTGQPGGKSSSWIKEPVYENSGLTPGQTCAYTVRMRDACGNVSRPSATVQARWDRPSVFVPDGSGMIVMEAENAQNRADGSAGRAWQPQDKPDGFSGSGVMAAMPDTGFQASAQYEVTCPRLDYRIRLDKGRHFLWIRGTGPNPGGDSVHAGINFAPIKGGENIETGPGKYRWVRMGPSLKIETAGLHILNLWMREDGVIVDKLILTRDEKYKPEADATGPAPTQMEAAAD